MKEKRTNISISDESGTAIWEQLLRLAEGGDLRAIKLYYEMLEKQQRRKSASDGEQDREMEQMAAIRRAVFGDAAEDMSGNATDAMEDSDDDAELL